MKVISALRKVKTFFKIRYGTVITYNFDVPTFLQSEVEVKRVDSSNVEDALGYEPKHKVETFKKFLSLGDWGYYAYLDGRWTHRSWVTFGPKKVDRWSGISPMNLCANEAFIHWCETATWARGRGVYSAVLSEIVEDCLNDKCQNIYISTNQENIASQKGILRAGFRESEREKIILFLGVRIRKSLT